MAAEDDSFALPFQPGEVIVGKYEVIGLIGTGGVGFVVSARHIGFDESVALKFLRPEFATHPEAVARFTIEARASFKIRSEHVARVLDVDCLPDGTPFMAMELLEGTDLRSLLDRTHALSIPLAVDCALEVCEALASAHARDVIHRDIKPGNLFLVGQGDETDHVKVLDFGISKVALTSSQEPRSLTRIAVGTPPYMSPEQMRASSDLDARSDIWSLGCVLYEAISGVAPFERMTLMQSCAAVLEEHPAPLRDLLPTIPAELDAVIARCLQKDPDARFASVVELAEALLPFGTGKRSGYANRCRALLRGERFGRKSTPSSLPLVPRQPSTFGGGNNSLRPTPLAAASSSSTEVEVVFEQAEPRRSKPRWPLVAVAVASFAIAAAGFLSLEARPTLRSQAQSSIAPARDPKSSDQPPPSAAAVAAVGSPLQSLSESPPPTAADDLKALEAAKPKRPVKIAAHKISKKTLQQVDEIDVGF